MEDFYVVLPSSVRNISGERNTTGHYYTYLPKPLALDKTQWKVAVVDISYVVSWLNVTSENCQVDTYIKGYKQSSHIPLKVYSNAEALVNGIKNVLRQHQLKSHFRPFSPSHPIALGMHAEEKISLHPMTSAMLGFNTNHFEIERGHARMVTIAPGRRIALFEATRPPNVHLPLQNLYIYTNLVDHILVGDTYAPLLQVVPIKNGQYGSVQHQQFLNPLYMSLSTGNISVIEIKLANERGEEVLFEFGSVVLKLHFKKIGA